MGAHLAFKRHSLCNRTEVLEVWRPYDSVDLGSRIRIIWEGSEYRGRGRQSIWDGSATFDGNDALSFTPINLWNIDKTVQRPAPNTLAWQTLTTGGFGGIDVRLEDAESGTLKIDTALAKAEIPIRDIGLEDIVLATGGGIKRQMRVFRLPDQNPAKTAKIIRRVKRNMSGETALYVCVTLEDGHLAWSSPIYLI